MKLHCALAGVISLLSLNSAMAGVSLSVTATDTTIKDLSGLNLEGSVETYLADGITVGGTYDYNEATGRPDEIYIKKSFEASLGDVDVDARYKVPGQKASLTAVLRRKADWLKLSLNNKNILGSVGVGKSFTLPGDRRLVIKPTYDHAKRAVDVLVQQDIQAGRTNAVLDYSQADNDAKLVINHNVDDNNIVSPTLSLKTGYVTYTWLHLFGDGAVLKAKLDPSSEVDLEWSDPGKGGNWVTKANVPLKEPRTATLSFKRRFSFY